MRAVTEGREFIVHPSFDDQIEEYLRPLFEKIYTMSFENYPVEIERLAAAGRHGLQMTRRFGAHMITLTLKEQPTVPLEAEVLSPDVIATLTTDDIRALPVHLGKRQRRLDDFFTVEGEASDELEIRGDASRSSGSAAA